METIKGSINSYKIGDSSFVEIPINDIEKFIIRHHTGRNGLIIEALLKEDVLSFVHVGHSEADKYGEVKRKYPVNYRRIHIRMKDNPRFRKKLYDALMKRETKTQTMGMNAGTPAAISWTVAWKEITPGEVFQ